MSNPNAPFYGSFRDWLVVSFDRYGTLYSSVYVDKEIAEIRRRVSWRLRVTPEAPPTPAPLPSMNLSTWVDQTFTDGMTLDEVGAAIGVTRERVRQIEAKAMRKLRKAVEREHRHRRRALHESGASSDFVRWFDDACWGDVLP